MFLHLLTEWGPHPNLILQALVLYKYYFKKPQTSKQEKCERIKEKKYPFYKLIQIL